jgi:hypothetical protein
MSFDTLFRARARIDLFLQKGMVTGWFPLPVLEPLYLLESLRLARRWQRSITKNAKRAAACGALGVRVRVSPHASSQPFSVVVWAFGSAEIPNAFEVGSTVEPMRQPRPKLNYPRSCAQCEPAVPFRNFREYKVHLAQRHGVAVSRARFRSLP